MGYTYHNTIAIGDHLDDCAPQIYVMKTNSGTATDRKECANALDTAFNDVYSDGFITGYGIYTYDIDKDLTCSKGLLTQLHEWRENNGFTEDAAYVAVHRCDESGASDPKNLWVDAVDCHASGHTNKNLTRAATHEVFHASTVHACDKVSSMTTSEYKEHALGTGRSVDGVKKWTPFGGPGPGTEGTCYVSDSSTVDGQTLLPSSCTKKAIKYSVNHELNGHLEDTC